MLPFIATSVVSIFADRPAAQAALDQLAGQGVPEARISLHERTPTSRNAVKLELDELVSGGFISNMSALLDGLFGHPVAKTTLPRMPTWFAAKELSFRASGRCR